MLLGRDGITNLTMLDDELSQHRTMAFVFPAFFIVVVLLTTITTMKRMVDQQRTQIGTLKALGMKKRKIYLHYLGYGFWTSLFGAVLGTIVGPMTLAPLLFIRNCISGLFLAFGDSYCCYLYPFHLGKLQENIAHCTGRSIKTCATQNKQKTVF